MLIRPLLDDLRRFLRTGSVIELGAAFALATVGVGFLSTVVNGLTVSPVNNSDSGVGLEGPGTFVIDHRVFDYEDTLFQLLIVGLVMAAVALVARWNREDIFGEKTFQSCPHCLAEIPAGASVCSFCTRDLPAQEASDA